jgi:hypothetical protein
MKPTGKLLRDIGNVLSPNDPELVEKTLKRLEEQDLWNDLFSTKLIEVLDALDDIKSASKSKVSSVELESTDLARRTLLAARLAIFACNLSLAVAVWAIWFSLRPAVPFLVPAAVVVALTVVLTAFGQRVASAA